MFGKVSGQQGIILNIQSSKTEILNFQHLRESWSQQIYNQVSEMRNEDVIDMNCRKEKQKSRKLIHRRSTTGVMIAKVKTESTRLTYSIRYTNTKNGDACILNLHKYTKALCCQQSGVSKWKKSNIYTIKMVSYNRNQTIQVLKDFHGDLYTSGDLKEAQINLVIRNVPIIAGEEIKRALKGTKRGRTSGRNRVRKKVWRLRKLWQ